MDYSGKVDLSKYIGIPYRRYGEEFTGCDCWGLIRLFYRNEFRFELPQTEPFDRSDNETVSREIKRTKVKWNRIKTARLGDVIVLNIAGYSMHTALAVTNSMMIHTLENHDSVIESFRSMKWEKRIEGIYRWRRHFFEGRY